MIIKTLEENQLPTAVAFREYLFAELNQLAVIVPTGTTEVVIDFDEELEGLVVHLKKGDEDLDTIGGFISLEECRLYAKIIVAEAGLNEDAITQLVELVE